MEAPGGPIGSVEGSMTNSLIVLLCGRSGLGNRRSALVAAMVRSVPCLCNARAIRKSSGTDKLDFQFGTTYVSGAIDQRARQLDRTG